MKYFILGIMASMIVGSLFSGLWVPIGSDAIAAIAHQIALISPK
jgi:hypothetical protein